MKLPDYVKEILNELHRNKYKAYVVGGALRDGILQRETSDYDIATDAIPEEVQRIFEDYKTLEVGKAFGTVIVLVDGHPLEVTTFRVDGTYSDGRRPDDVVFSESLKEDLSRRDFTINAMAYNEKEGLIDPFGGLEDIQKKIVRAVGDPGRRFEEDALRILRALRFATVLNFSLAPDLMEACIKYSHLTGIISHERIQQEFNRILRSDAPGRGLDFLHRARVSEVLFPELERMVGFDQHSSNHPYDLWEHTLRVVEGVPPDLELRLAALLHDVGKPERFFLGEDGEGHFYGHQSESSQVAESLLRRLKYPNKTIDGVKLLIERHMDCMNIYTPRSVKRLLSKMGEEGTRKLFQLQKADIRATAHKEDVGNVQRGEEILEEILEKQEAWDTGGLVINGDDLLAMGYRQGKFLGDVLREITNQVVEGTLLNERDALMTYGQARLEDLESQRESF